MPDRRSKNLFRNSAKTFLALSLAAVVIAALPASATDTQPPVLTGFTFSPMAVDTTTNPATVTVTAQVTDDLSGVRYVEMGFASPSGHQSQGCGMGLISGTDLNGTWQCTVTIPAYSEAGTWTVGYVVAGDNVGNQVYYYTSQLQTLGFPTTLQVTSNQDTTPPVLTGFTFSPMAVDTTTNPATVTVTAQVTDDLSGVRYVEMGFASPSGHQSQGCGMGLISGTDLNGTWQCTVTIPAYSEAGTWTVGYVVAGDNVGNQVYYYTSQLQALGFPTTLQVTSNQDTTPPVLTGFTFSPMAVDTTTNPATVTVTAQVTDDLSGVRYVEMGFASPSGHQSQGCGMGLISGTDLNGTWQCTVTIPAYSEAGTWTVGYVVAGDNVGNQVYYYTSQLQTLGFPTQLIVDSTSSVALASSANPSSYGEAVTFTATVTSSSGGGTPTGTVDFFDGSTQIGSGTLDANGVTTFTTSTLTIGTHSIVAEYLGDSSHPAADSPPLSQVVTPAVTTITLTSSASNSHYGQPVIFTATVSSSAGPPPDGETIQFRDGQTKLGTGVLSQGTAIFKTASLSPGVHTIYARYLGDATLQGSITRIQQWVRQGQ